MNPAGISRLLRTAFAHKFPVLIYGKPGVGKTAVVVGTARSLNMRCMLLHPAISESVDFKGYPVPRKMYRHENLWLDDLTPGQDQLTTPVESSEHRHVVEFLPDIHLDRLRTADRPTLCFCDDIGQSTQSVQAGMMQLIHGGRLNGQKISPHVVFCGATNSIQDQAGVSGLIEPFKGRWTIVEMSTSLDDWIAWARGAMVDDRVIAFLKTRGELLHQFKPSRGMEKSPDPRAWHWVSNWLKQGERETELIAGCVGTGAATEFSAFLTLAEKCPKLEDVIKNPTGVTIPKEMSLQYLVVIGLSRMLNRKNIGAVTTFLSRLSESLRCLCMRDAVLTTPEITDTPEFIRWARLEAQDLLR